MTDRERKFVLGVATLHDLEVRANAHVYFGLLTRPRTLSRGVEVTYSDCKLLFAHGSITLCVCYSLGI